jgi:hypothetical protein
MENNKTPNKVECGDLVFDYSEDNIVNVGYICTVHTDKSYPKTVSYRTMYQVYWLQPDPAYGDFFTMQEIKSYVSSGIWKLNKINKNVSRTRKKVRATSK